MDLPLCPCGSNKLYEECCYKKKGDNGEPLYFKGAWSSDSGGTSWHPIPNVRYAAIIVGKEIDKHRSYAEDLVAKSKLDKTFHDKFINFYAVYYRSYEQLLESLTVSHGKGISFQTDTVYGRQNWRGFLNNGRALLDYLGLHCKETLGLNQRTSGINRKKFGSLIAILTKQSSKDSHLMKTIIELEDIREEILTFIDFRDREKVAGDTIREFPSTDSEYGVVKDGLIRLDGRNYNMIEFIRRSHEAVLKITLILLGIQS